MTPREYTYSPESLEDLARLQIQKVEFDALDLEMKSLAEQSTPGYEIAFSEVIFGEKLYRHDIGRFGLVLRCDEHTLDLLEVI